MKRRSAKRAFRLDCAIIAALRVGHSNTNPSQEIYRALISNISDTGCKIAIEHPDLPPLPIDACVTLELKTHPPIQLDGLVKRHAESVEGWGHSLGIVFTDITVAQHKKLAAVFLTEDNPVSRPHVRQYRSRRRQKHILVGLIMVAAAILGFCSMIFIQETMHRMQREAELAEINAGSGQQKRGLIGDSLEALTPEERERFWKAMTPDERSAILKEAEQTSQADRK